MSKHRHRYLTTCPKCKADLTADNTVVIHFIVADCPGETASRLDQDGWLVDIDNVVARGHHSGTDCRACGVGIDGHELLGNRVAMRGRKCKTRRVEYYRLWGGDHGTWDTDFIDIPADTPDDMVDRAIRKAAGKIKWRDEVPVIVGCYNDACEDEEDEDDESSSELTPPSTAPEDRDRAINDLLAKAEAAGLEPEDLDEVVHGLAGSVAADVNNEGLKGQIGYLIDQLGVQDATNELERLAEANVAGEADEGREPIRGECHTDDRVYSAEFNALTWFDQAKDDDILQLAQEDWGDGYAADEVGMFMADSVADVQKMFEYLEHYNQAHKEHIGWVCTVDKDDVLQWLKAHRPQLYRRVLKIEED